MAKESRHCCSCFFPCFSCFCLNDAHPSTVSREIIVPSPANTSPAVSREIVVPSPASTPTATRSAEIYVTSSGLNYSSAIDNTEAVLATAAATSSSEGASSSSESTVQTAASEIIEDAALEGENYVEVDIHRFIKHISQLLEPTKVT